MGSARYFMTAPTNLPDAVEVVVAVGRSLQLVAQDELSPADLLRTLRSNKFPLLSLVPQEPAPTASTESAQKIEISADERNCLDLLHSPEFTAAVDEDLNAYSTFHGEYVRLVEAWTRHGIDAVCIKSAGIAPSFPYTSDNFDILVRANHVGAARQILLDFGYVEMTNTEEQLKWLFRRFEAGRNVSLIHLHARVAWEEGFMLEDELWPRARRSPDDPWTWVPGREDSVLINLAHAVMENKSMTLHDLTKIRFALQGGDIDWDYVEHVALRRGWLSCLHFGLLLIAQLEEHLYEVRMIPEEFRARCEATVQHNRWLDRYWSTLHAAPPVLPFSIPFVLSKILFFEKLWRDQDLLRSERPMRTLRALAAGAKQKGGFHLQNSMLVTLSGVDGGGKSSHAQALHDVFTVSHVQSRIAWTRIGDTPMLRMLRRARKHYQQVQGTANQRVFSRTGWRLTAWSVLATADYAAWLQTVRWGLLRGDVVFADRYLCDFEVELSIRLREHPRLASTLMAALGVIAPKAKCAYLLRVDPRVSKDRKPDSDFRDLDPEDMQRRYDALVERYELRVFDASRSFDELVTAIGHDALSAYMADFGPLLRNLFFANPWQLNRPEKERS